MSRRLVVGIVLVVVLVAAGALAVVLPAATTGSSGGRGDGAVAVVELLGQIQEGPVGLRGSGITPSLVRDRLETAAEHPRVDATVVRVESGGGTVAASQEIADLIAGHPNPVVVSMADQAASGGYYISVGADRVVAQPGTLTGSIGVVIPRIDPTGLLDELGVELDVIHTGEHKDMAVPGQLDDEERQLLQDLSDDLYEQFVSDVAAGRDLSESEVEELATGQLYTGEEAVDLGLVDELGGVDEAVGAAAELAGVTDPEVVELQPGLLDQLLGGGPGFGGAFRLLDADMDAKQLLTRELLRGWGTPQYRTTPLNPEARR